MRKCSKRNIHCEEVRDRIIADYPQYSFEVDKGPTRCDSKNSPRRIILNEYEFCHCDQVILFDILHEIGHAENDRKNQARCLREYNASKWAIGHCRKYSVNIPKWRQDDFQQDVYKWKQREKKLMNLLQEYPRKKFPKDEDLLLDFTA